MVCGVSKYFGIANRDLKFSYDRNINGNLLPKSYRSTDKNHFYSREENISQTLYRTGTYTHPHAMPNIGVS